jgi:hypothetical protein
VIGDLTAASASLESESICTTGEDLWYQFTATSSGARIRVESTEVNLLVELQDAAGNMINVENVQSTLGNEILNFGNLTPGEMYYISVRNYNSGQGNGTFSICCSALLATSSDYLYPEFSLCSVYKADYVGAQAYTFHFTPVGGGTTLTYTKYGTTKIALYVVNGLAYNTSYLSTIDAVYNLTNGIGAYEMIAVQGVVPHQVNIGDPSVATIRSTDICPAIKTMNSYIRETPHICGCGQFAWEVTRTDIPSLPQIFLGPANSKNFQIRNSNGFYAGGTYSVRVSPVFGTEAPANFGSSYCISVAGAAGMPLVSVEETTNEITGDFISIYPNQSSGHVVISAPDNSITLITVTNMIGEKVYADEMDGDLILSDLPSGIYLIQFTIDSQTIVRKLVVE